MRILINVIYVDKEVQTNLVIQHKHLRIDHKSRNKAHNKSFKISAYKRQFGKTLIILNNSKSSYIYNFFGQI